MRVTRCLKFKWNRQLVIATLSTAVLCCALYAAKSREPSVQRTLLGIKHIVIVVQENRSTDNLLNGFPGLDTVRKGRDHVGREVSLEPTDFNTPYDIDHSLRDFVRDYDNGKMDGFDLERVGALPGALRPGNFGRYPQYRYLRRDVVEPYFAMAAQYAVADRMFQSNLEQSFAAHLFLIAATSGGAVNVPAGLPWGCDASNTTSVAVINSMRKVTKRVFPCFGFRTIGDELDDKHLTWAYYAPQVGSAAQWRKYNEALRSRKPMKGVRHPDFGGLWSSYDAIDHARFGPQWSDNVLSPETSILRDIRSKRLRAVSWVVPDFRNSDHALSRSATGPDWVASIINEIGRSPYWDDTIIFVTWDDSGGWYDHVAPPQLSYDGLGTRVPLIVVGRAVRRGYINHDTLEFGSILKFIETRFDLAPLTDVDRRSSNLLQFLLERPPKGTFQPIKTRYSTEFFLEKKPSYLPPDDD